ncbi:MAG: selenoneine biosynthesis selenosugar synthase SenB [Pirellulales bacterium]
MVLRAPYVAAAVRMSMQILIVTPVPRGSRRGNRITADRYARLLRRLGHRALVAEDYRDQACDVLVALHARKSYEAIKRFRVRRPDAPLVVVLTGTDLYRDLPKSPAANESLRWATRLVLLQSDGVRFLPPEVRHKACAIVQSCEPPKVHPRPLSAAFEVTTIGHLRAVKDPFRTALAARRLPADSRIQVVQLGASLSPAMARRALAEQRRNLRYRWLGDVPRPKALRMLARSRLTVVSSKLEGGPNVVSEALAVGTPVLASRISGVVGMLGADYPGYFDVRDTAGLTALLLRAERDAKFYEQLRLHCRSLAPTVEPRRELAAWKELLAELRPPAK